MAQCYFGSNHVNLTSPINFLAAAAAAAVAVVVVVVVVVVIYVVAFI